MSNKVKGDSQQRKDTPIFSGFVKYFPQAMGEVARLSKTGNDKHNPGEPLHWSKGKSNDHGDCIIRHQIDAGTIDDEDGFYHDVKVAWRAMAQLEILMDKLAEEDNEAERKAALGRAIGDALGCRMDDVDEPKEVPAETRYAMLTGVESAWWAHTVYADQPDETILSAFDLVIGQVYELRDSCGGEVWQIISPENGEVVRTAKGLSWNYFQYYTAITEADGELK